MKQQQDVERRAVQAILASIKSAGISMALFSDVTGISRQTMYYWKNGRRPTDKLRLSRAARVATGLNKAVENKLLPFTEYRKRKEQAARLKEILLQMGVPR